MALIEIEFIKPAFQGIVGMVIKTGRAVPIPTLAPLGDDRLILSFRWQGDPLIVRGFQGYIPPAGTVLLSSSVIVSHASLAEIKLQPDTQGVLMTGTAWISVVAMRQQVTVNLVGFDAGHGPVRLPAPQLLGTFPLPSMEGIAIVGAAFVASESVIVLRLATSAYDDLLQPAANRLSAALASQSNWLIHLSPGIFVEMVLGLLNDALSSPPGGLVIEEAPTASWTLLESGTWGVAARAGLKKIDACPGLFGDVDVSVEVSVAVAFAANTAGDQINMTLTIETNASDWDSFRCWLGSPLGIGSYQLRLIHPFLGIAASIASLVLIGEQIREQVADESGSASVSGFTEVSRSDNSATYTGTVPFSPLPFSSEQIPDFGLTGFDLRGKIFPMVADHKTSFAPDRGPLAGEWTSAINCSHRTRDYSFSYQPVIVSDALVFAGRTVREVPVVVYLTSVAEPAGKCWIDMWNSHPRLAVNIKAPGMRIGDKGFVVLHTSAGLRAFDLGAVPVTPASLPGMQGLIDRFCNTFHVPSLVIDVQELKWVEPPPDYGWGYAPLRQWQVVLQELPANTAIEVRANSEEGPILANQTDFFFSENAAVLELVTDAETNLFLRIPNAGTMAKIRHTTRWLVPQHRQAFDVPLQAFTKAGSMLLLRTANGDRTFNLNNWTINNAPRESTGNTRTFRQGQSLTFQKNRIAIIHGGELVIAVPVNTLKRNI